MLMDPTSLTVVHASVLLGILPAKMLLQHLFRKELESHALVPSGYVMEKKIVQMGQMKGKENTIT